MVPFKEPFKGTLKGTLTVPSKEPFKGTLTVPLKEPFKGTLMVPFKEPLGIDLRMRWNIGGVVLQPLGRNNFGLGWGLGFRGV